jgi:type I restriction enzyme S subunit
LKVQASISRLLTAIDLKISTNKNISQTIENIAQCVFQSWFIDFDYVTDELVEGDRVLELNPRTLVESEVGLIPSGWEVKSLSHLLTLHKKTVKPSELTSAAPYVPIDQISPRTVFLHNCLPGELAQTSLVTFEKMDILFGAMRPYFHKVALAPFSGTTRTTTFVLKPKISDSLCFALFTVFQNRAIEYATSHSQGTTIPYAAWSNSFENYRYVQPPLSLVAKFNDLVLPLLEYGHSLLRENQSLLAIRDLLLPRLISGELQIPDEMLES